MDAALLHDTSVLKPSAPISGREGLEYSTEADMKLVSLCTKSIVPGLVGLNTHHQLRDCFALSSIGTCDCDL